MRRSYLSLFLLASIPHFYWVPIPTRNTDNLPAENQNFPFHISPAPGSFFAAAPFMLAKSPISNLTWINSDPHFVWLNANVDSIPWTLTGAFQIDPIWSNTPPDCRSRSCRPGLPHQWPFRPYLDEREENGVSPRGKKHHDLDTMFTMHCLSCFYFYYFFFLNHVFSPIFFPDHHLKFSIDLPRDAISAGMLCWSGGTGWKPISGSLGRPTGVGRWLQSVGISYAYFKDKPGINQNL